MCIRRSSRRSERQAIKWATGKADNFEPYFVGASLPLLGSVV